MVLCANEPKFADIDQSPRQTVVLNRPSIHFFTRALSFFFALFEIKDNFSKINIMQPLSQYALRALANLAQSYQTWVTNAKILAPGRLAWKTVSGRDYLYRIVDGKGNGTSLGPRNASTEAAFTRWQAAKEQQPAVDTAIKIHVATCRAAGTPMLPEFAGKSLQSLDIAGLVGDNGLLVVGTNAVLAYAIEAQMRPPPEIEATQDFDMTWVSTTPTPSSVVLDALRRGDPSWVVNQERTFQALNKHADEFEILLPASLATTLKPTLMGFRSVPMDDHDWLLPGMRISHVLPCFGGIAARIEAPDPRWFALQKLWLADKPERNPLKKPKDRALGLAVLDLVAGHMPQFELDKNFLDELPDPLAPYFEQWLSNRPRPK